MAEFEHQRRIAAGKIRDRFPSIKSLRIEQIYTDPDGMTSPTIRTSLLDPESSAYLRYECPYRECVQGGFDLLELVNNLVQSMRLEASGYLLCNGWQDPERIGSHRCFCRLSYKLFVEYNIEQTSV